MQVEIPYRWCADAYAGSSPKPHGSSGNQTGWLFYPEQTQGDVKVALSREHPGDRGQPLGATINIGQCERQGRSDLTGQSRAY